MKISRWIYIPLIISLSSVLPQIVFGGSGFGIWFLLFYGTIFGFTMLLLSNHKAKQVTGENNEEIHRPRQHRVLTVLLDYEKTFAVCQQAAESLNPAKIKTSDFSAGVIEFRTRINWHTFGHIFMVNTKKINEKLTEVEVSSRPIPRTALVSSGYSWKYIEDFCSFIKKRDSQINQKVLTDSAEILSEVYVKPFQRETPEIKK